MVEVNRMSEWGGRVVVRVYISGRLSSLFRHALAFSQLSPLLESKKYACLKCCPLCISPVVDEPLLCFRDMEWYNFNIGTFSLLCMQLCKTCSESAVQVKCAELPTPNRLEFQNSNSLFLAQIQSLESLNWISPNCSDTFKIIQHVWIASLAKTEYTIPSINSIYFQMQSYCNTGSVQLGLLWK